MGLDLLFFPLSVSLEGSNGGKKERVHSVNQQGVTGACIRFASLLRHPCVTPAHASVVRRAVDPDPGPWICDTDHTFDTFAGPWAGTLGVDFETFIHF